MGAKKIPLALLKARSFSDAMIANAKKFNLNIATTSPTLPDGGWDLWVWKLWAGTINGFYDVSSRMYVPRNGGIDFASHACTYVRSIYPVFSL